jgi:hypothetical protein
MEVRFEQLLVLVLVLLGSLFDLFRRRHQRRAGQAEPDESDDGWPTGEDPLDGDDTESPVSVGRDGRDAALPSRAPVREGVREGAREGVREGAREGARRDPRTAGRDLRPRAAVPRSAPASRAIGPGHRTPPLRLRAGDARRGIILMEILGPCRAVRAHGDDGSR